MMRVVAHTVSYPPYRQIGAERATHALMSHIAAAGHSAVVCPSTVPGCWAPYTVGGVLVARPALVDVTRPDVVLAHAGQAWPGRRHAQRTGAPFVLSCHGDGGHPGWLAAAVAGSEPDLVIVNSEHMRQNVMRAVNNSMIVTLNPPVWPGVRAGAGPGGDVVLVNTAAAKGADVFWAVARARPGRRFVGVAGGYGDQVPPPADLENATVLPPTGDMATVWARAGVLLVPSHHESWGMVAVEAMDAGVPVVASDVPGLREALGGAGTLVPPGAAPEVWAAAVDDAYARHEAMAAAGRARALELHPAAALDAVVRRLECLVSGRMGA